MMLMRIKIKMMMRVLILILTVGIISCKAAERKTEPPAEPIKPVSEAPTQIPMEKKVEKKFSEPLQSTVEPNKKYQAVIKTEKGDITVDLFAGKAPMGVTNFIQLAKGGFYDGLTFHRVEPGFVIQGGDPEGNGTGGPGYTIPAEIGPKHLKGALAWARTGDQVNPERRSSGSQFYVTLEATPFLDEGYSVFGQTVSGMDVVEKIRRGDKILAIEIIEQ
jgi:cyclophilin family peptidyl-prolyl cis-trans isomerase